MTTDISKTSSNSISSTLKTLVILTFIGSFFFNFVGPIYHYINIDKNIVELEKSIHQLKQKSDEESIMVGSLEDALDASYKARENKKSNLITDLIAGILCIVGAALMMKLNKNGFFVYTIGEFLPVIFHFVMFGLGSGKFAIFTSAFAIIIPLAFVIAYAVQLKDME
jgi:hypothetical protein